MPLHEYETNVREMVRIARNDLLHRDNSGVGMGLVVWLSTTPVDDHRHNVVYKQSWRRYNADVKLYNESAARVMASEGVPIIDLHSFTAECLGTAAGRDHGHMREDASAAQGAYIARRILDLVPSC
eukprot:COSAG02_NODE_9_length_59728_cov_36.104714_48_plen_126_part_00